MARRPGSMATAVVSVAAVLAAVLTAAPSAADGSWTARTIASENLNDVAFATASRGWAVGNAGTILSTEDGGATWATRASGTTAHLYAVDFVDDLNGWAVGGGDTILRTTDGGQTWTRLAPGTTLARFDDVDFVDATHGWVVGTSLFTNVVLATDDGGQTWVPQVAPAGTGLVSVSFADREHGFAVGYLDAAYRTDDAGRTWAPMAVQVETFDGLTTESFYAARRISPQEGLLAGFRGRIYRTEDGGLTWATVAELDARVNGLAVSAAAAYAVGNGGLAARSEDGGQTWEVQPSATGAHLQGVSAPAPDAAFAVGTGGMLATFQDTPEELLPLTVAPFGETCHDGLQGRSVYGAAGRPSVSAAADLNGDGDHEIVVAGPEGIRALAPFRPMAEATIWEIPFQTIFNDVRPAELDGIPGSELVVSVRFSSAPRSGVLAVDGDSGEVLWSRRLPSGGMLRVADLTGNGLDDLVHAGGRTLRFLSGADGSDLLPPQPMGEQITDLETADLTGDGVADVVVTLRDGRAVAVSGARADTLWVYRAENGALHAVALGDVTGDGLPDAVVGGQGVPASLVPQRGDGQSTIGTRRGALVALLDGRTGQVRWDYGQPGQVEIGAVTLADLTADGVPDVVAHGSRFGRGHLLALAGTGRRVAGIDTREAYPLWVFDTTRGDGAFQGVHRPDALATGDATGDGVPDAFVATWNGGVFAVAGSPPPTANDPAVGIPQGAPLWEAVREGPARHLSLLRAAGQLFVLAATDDGMLALRDAATGELTWAHDGGQAPVAAAGRFDGVAGMGLVLGTAAGRVFAVDGDGTPLAPATDRYLPSRVVGVAAIDVTGDGVDEMVAVSADGVVRAFDAATPAVRWETSLGTDATRLAAGAGVLAVGTADGRLLGLDAGSGDQLWELEAEARVTAAAYSERSRFFVAGDAAGQFLVVDPDGSPQAGGWTDTAGQGGVSALLPADLDGDGRDEVVVAAGHSFYGFRADGQLVWRRDASYFATQLAVGDLDGDGAEDVLGGSLDYRAYAIDGRTGSVQWMIDNGWPGGLAVADLDGDGRNNALVGRTNVDFPARIQLVGDAGAPLGHCAPRKVPRSIWPGDLDGEGDTAALVVMQQGDVYRIELSAPEQP